VDVSYATSCSQRKEARIRILRRLGFKRFCKWSYRCASATRLPGVSVTHACAVSLAHPPHDGGHDSDGTDSHAQTTVIMSHES
jgi:hypothetical protein